MTSGVLKIKAGIAWFPAPVQWRALMAMISDGAFKLFVYVCLNADRRTARFQFNQTALARELGKSRRSIATYLGELQAHSVCTVTMSANQHAAGGLQIQAPYWPFEWDIPQIPTTLGAQECYVQAIATYLQSQSCVRARFSSLDRELAEQWFRQGVELWHVEQGILMGCGRKYVSWLNGAQSQPIGSLHYFKPTVQEVIEAQKTSPRDYWDFNKQQVARLQKRWLAGHAEESVPAQIFRRQNTETR